ncbi:MAG: LysR family transcriptional regulator [Rhodoferax sp.]|jgi:DNA-binding transcriptional LysR family regulator|nr:LysR family transcriptional regulator [Rhodoferax sp.]
MAHARDVLTPDALSMLQSIARSGSFAAAARALGVVPSALTYRVRQIEDALDVLLFDRSTRQARLTPAGETLLSEGVQVLDAIDALANRVKRVATGWEPQLTIAVDGIISQSTMMELCESFLAQAPPTRLRLREEALSGTLHALTSGQADLAIGVVDVANHAEVHSRPLGESRFVYAVAPHHPLAVAPEPLSDAVLRQHRVIAAADSIPRGGGVTIGLMDGQDVLTVATMRAKIDAQLRGLGGGHVPECMAADYIATGRLVVRQTERPPRTARVNYAWRGAARSRQGRALQWWLRQLESPATRLSLLTRQGHG